MLAAAAHGLGSCIGWWDANGREHARRLLAAPDGSIVRTVLPIGSPATGHRPMHEDLLAGRTGSARKPIPEFVRLERYDGERGAG